ncbi:Uncharacterised protein [Mycobacteroides abscessus subsp. abscessus]|nr:Uncharacterised protein [Mycobacteroides abscessus subsp. abscessus]
MERASSDTPARGEAIPGSRRTGRRFTYWLKARRNGISRPHNDTSSGTPGYPTAPSRIASNPASVVGASGGIIAPVLAYLSQE